MMGLSLKPSLFLFGKNDPLRMAGATAFFTTFALPPIVFLLALIFGLVIGRREMGRGLVQNISGVLGEDGAGQVRQVIRSIIGFDDSWYVIVPGILFLFFVATTLFNVIRTSMNQIWNTGLKEKSGVLFNISVRLRSFAIIVALGILFFADIALSSVEAYAGAGFTLIWPEGSFYFKSIINEIASIIIVAAWFIILFRFIADARPPWKACIPGGILTGTLFTIGKVILKILLINSNVRDVYGASGSFVLILLFVFYSSFILYYGASFIAVYCERMNWPIKLNTQAVSIHTSKDSVQ